MQDSSPRDASTVRRFLGSFSALAAIATLGLSSMGVSSVASAAPPPGAAEPTEAFPVGPGADTAWDIPGTLVLDAEDDLSDAEVVDLGFDFGLWLTPTALEDDTRIQIATLAEGASAASVLASLRADPRVERAEPLAWVQAFFTPDDPLLKNQWHMERIGAPRAWDFATGRGVTVAVVDTGIACETHGPFMKGTDLAQTDCAPGWSFVTNDEHANDDQGHGSHVAGTIAQSTNNGIGAAGVAFHATLMPVKVLNSRGWGTTADVADGIRWAADHGAQVINLSLGGPRNSKVLQSAVDHARSKGVVIVAAAGNSGGPVGYPGASDGVIGVSATEPNDKLAKFSSRGIGVDIAAPGVNVIQQTVCENGRNKCEVFPGFSGTSMASPHVAGAAALLVGLGVSDPAAVQSALASSARVVDDSDGASKLYGAGVLDAASAVQSVTLKQGIVRLLLLLGIVGIATVGARRKSKEATPFSMSFWVAALATGPGLLFFAPWVVSRVHTAVDVLARPIAELDLYVGAGLHGFLPLANALVPLGLSALLFGFRGARPLIAGASAGTAAYLLSVAVLGQASGPFGQLAMMVWCAANAVACMWFARFHLAAATEGVKKA